MSQDARMGGGGGGRRFINSAMGGGSRGGRSERGPAPYRPSGGDRGGQFGRSGGGQRPRFFASGRGGGGGAPQRRRARPQEDPRLGGGRGPQKPKEKPKLMGDWGKQKKVLGAIKEDEALAENPPKISRSSSDGTVVPSQQGQTDQQAAQKTAQLVGTLTKTLPVTEVQISGNVILAIQKQIRGNENGGKTRTGQLYGMKHPKSGRLEITFAIGAPATNKTKKDDDDYCKKVMECLESTNVDKMAVGWYRTCNNGGFYDEQTVNRCAEWKTHFPPSVMLVYDSAATKNGRLVLRCFQLEPAFHALQTSGKRGCLGHTALYERGITYKNVFREIPVKVHNSWLVHAFLFELKLSCGFERLAHDNNQDVSQNLTDLEKCIEDYTQYQSDYRTWTAKVQRVLKDRDRARKETTSAVVLQNIGMMYPLPPEPSRMKSVLATGQMAEYADQMKNALIQMHAKMQIQAPLNGVPTSNLSG